MSTAEIEACTHLILKAATTLSEEEEVGDTPLETSYEELLEARKKRRTMPGGHMGYGNVDFILGSAAQVERLWSIADNVLTDKRKATTLLLFESIMFLRMNERFWNVHLIRDAFHMSRSDRANQRMDEDQQEEAHLLN